MNEPTVISRAWLEQNAALAQQIAEYEAEFGTCKYYLSTEYTDPDLYCHIGLIELPAADADSLLKLPMVERRFYESAGKQFPALVVLANITNYVMED